MKLYTLDNEFIRENHFLPPNNFTGIIVDDDGTRTRTWYCNGLLHRFNGPAIEYSNGTKEWYINDREINEEQHNLCVDIMKLKGLL